MKIVNFSYRKQTLSIFQVRSTTILMVVLVCVSVLPLSVSAQKFKKPESVKKPPTNINKLKQGSRLNSNVMLSGSKQLGLRGVYISTGYGFEIDAAYGITNELMGEIGIGYHSEEFKGAMATRIPLHLGAKYRVLDVKKFLLVYGGLAFNSYFQSYENLPSDDDVGGALIGPSIFGETMLGLKSKWSIVLRAEQVIVLNQKIENSEGTEESLYLLNLSFGIRKIL